MLGVNHLAEKHHYWLIHCLSDCDNAVSMPPADLVACLLISFNDLLKWSFQWYIYLFIYISI